MLNRSRCFEGKLVALGILAVKKTQRVFVKALTAGIAELVLFAFIIGNESLSVLRTALTAAD